MSVSTLPYSLHVKQTTKHLSPPPFGILFPKTDNNANDIFKTLSESKQRKEVGLVMQLTIQYARLRVDHLIAAPTDKLHSAAERSQGHIALIAAINTLAEAMESAHEETLWRQTLGQNRKDIGDFACFIHCIPTSPQGDPTKHVARAFPGRSPTAGAAASISAIAMMTPFLVPTTSPSAKAHSFTTPPSPLCSNKVGCLPCKQQAAAAAAPEYPSVHALKNTTDQKRGTCRDGSGGLGNRVSLSCWEQRSISLARRLTASRHNARQEIRGSVFSHPARTKLRPKGEVPGLRPLIQPRLGLMEEPQTLAV